MEFLPWDISFFKNVVANFSEVLHFDFFKQLTFNFTECVSNDFQRHDDANLHRLHILNGCHVKVEVEETPIFNQAVQFIDVGLMQKKIFFND